MASLGTLKFAIAIGPGDEYVPNLEFSKATAQDSHKLVFVPSSGYSSLISGPIKPLVFAMEMAQAESRNV